MSDEKKMTLAQKVVVGTVVASAAHPVLALPGLGLLALIGASKLGKAALAKYAERKRLHDLADKEKRDKEALKKKALDQQKKLEEQKVREKEERARCVEEAASADRRRRQVRQELLLFFVQHEHELQGQFSALDLQAFVQLALCDALPVEIVESNATEKLEQLLVRLEVARQRKEEQDRQSAAAVETERKRSEEQQQKNLADQQEALATLENYCHENQDVIEEVFPRPLLLAFRRLHLDPALPAEEHWKAINKLIKELFPRIAEERARRQEDERRRRAPINPTRPPTP
jgi:hypothetical protein